MGSLGGKDCLTSFTYASMVSRSFVRFATRVRDWSPGQPQRTIITARSMIVIARRRKKRFVCMRFIILISACADAQWFCGRLSDMVPFGERWSVCFGGSFVRKCLRRQIFSPNVVGLHWNDLSQYVER